MPTDEPQARTESPTASWLLRTVWEDEERVSVCVFTRECMSEGCRRVKDTVIKR